MQSMIPEIVCNKSNVEWIKSRLFLNCDQNLSIKFSFFVISLFENYFFFSSEICCSLGALFMKVSKVFKVFTISKYRT